MPKSDLPSGVVRQSLDELDPLLRCNLAEIIALLDGAEERGRGLALEALAFHLMGFLGLEYVGTRLRAMATGGAETDLVFEGRSLYFHRWQVQCRNATTLNVDDVAKEAGLLGYLGSDVGVVVCTGEIDPRAVGFARTARRGMRQPIVLIDGRTLRSSIDNPAAVIDAVRAQAPEALTPAH